MSTTTLPSPDALLAEAVDLARAAAEADAAPSPIGEHQGVSTDPEADSAAPVVIHRFASLTPAYTGWCWSVALTRLVDGGPVTVDEVVLEPGGGALLPPPWVPWKERLRPGDLGVGDLLPTPPDDARLVPSYTASGDPAVDDVGVELGLGRVRVMSRAGRLDAAERWHEGDTGPEAPMARQAPAHCGTCGFYLPLEGSLRAALGVCGNEYAPSDGRVVAVEFGCGAHSEAVPEPEPEPLGAVSYDTEEYDVLDPPRVPEPG